MLFSFLRRVMEKYQEGQSNIKFVFVDVAKAYDRVPREEVWVRARIRGVTEKYLTIAGHV